MPYLVHLIEVAIILREDNMPEDIIIAGLLHDTLEDTEVSKEEIEDKFGQRVLDLVLGASEELEGREERPWKARKEHTIEYLADSPMEVKYVACADKLSNIRSMLKDFEEIGEDLWTRFNQVDPLEQLWYYKGLRESLKDLEDYDMYKEFAKSVDLLEAKII